jgi:adenylate cyclase class IV
MSIGPALASGFSQNLELKARCSDLGRARRAAMERGAVVQGFLHQTDTYFYAADGRLKLREIREELGGAGSIADRAELIWYDRPNDLEPRACNYKVVPIPKASELIAALRPALGVRGIVRKKRELLLWHNVRIHLDTVEDLGTFIEFEAVIASDGDRSPEKSAKRISELRAAMAIRDEDLVSHSYSDLLKL